MRFRLKTHTHFDAILPFIDTKTAENADENKGFRNWFRKWSLLKM